MADGTVSKQGDLIYRRADGTTFDGTAALVPSAIVAGTATVTTTAAALAPSSVCVMVMVMASPLNVEPVLLGDESAQTWPLYAGQSLVVPIDDPSKILVRMASGSSGEAHYLVMA